MVGTIPMGQMTIEAGIVVWKEIQKIGSTQITLPHDLEMLVLS